MTKKVFIIGSRGIPAHYGGIETIAQKLIEHKKSNAFEFFIASRRSNNNPPIAQKTFLFHDATVFQIDVPNIGPATPIIYDIQSINWVIKYVKNNPQVDPPIIYIFGVTIGPLIKIFKKKFKKYNIKVLINPDGLEWKRAKWPKPVQTYLKIAEASMVKNADLVVSDSLGIVDYLNQTYAKYPFKTTYIAYGVDKNLSLNDTDRVNGNQWLLNHHLVPKDYFLVVARLVPENNFETILNEFMKSKTRKKLVLITTDNGKFFEYLKKTTNFSSDNRIQFLGTVYDEKTLTYIRNNAFAYIHGHSVGGTNPTLIEAMESVRLNLLFDVSFNRYIAEDSALYWSLNKNSLAKLIDNSEKITDKQVLQYSAIAKKRIQSEYTWEKISQQYAKLFLEEVN